ncbi:hypothetical protein MNV49_004111 [Pseudohyphozyma bogoriensis]|nr:hypothetical protein MNV49_004111 [Pseudohyphozyma bogoriensis]
MLGLHEAEILVRSFLQDLNPLIKILDKYLHTHDFIRTSSPVLYAAVLAASAKFFRKDLYPQLLSQAQQLVGRAMLETVSHIGVIKAICILIYWKESHDRSAWMRVGWCLRLAFQLNINSLRTSILPADELEARIILDRERTWMNLLCLNSTYRLSYEFDQTPQLPTPDSSAVDRWVEESVGLGNLEDIYLGASIEVSKINRLIGTLDSVPSPSSDILRGHINELIRHVYQKYFDPECQGSKAIGGTPAFNKTRMALDAASVHLSRTRLVETGFTDTVALADYAKQVSNLVDTLEVLEVFLAVCNRCTGDREDGAPAFIARFYRLLLFHSAQAVSVPSTRPPSPAGASEDAAANSTIQQPYQNPFDELDWLVQEELDSRQTNGQNPLVADNEYWESLLPGTSTDVFNWLDPNQFSVGLDDNPLPL